MNGIEIRPAVIPDLDPDHVPAALWHRAFDAAARAAGGPRLDLALVRPDGTCFRHSMRILPHEGAHRATNLHAVERTLKFLLWMKGAPRILVAGCDALAADLAAIYRDGGARAFDVDLVGRRVFLEPITVRPCPAADLPAAKDPVVALGRHLDGCRIGFDLGGSDRKCAALIDGRVVHSEEVAWDPYFQKDPQYHIEGVRDTLRRAAAHLPRVDAIGGSSAGVFVNNEPRVASLFRGVSREDFDRHIRPLFHDLRREWHGVPFEVANDGEVTALAGSMSMNDNAVLGVSMGTSVAAGWCDAGGHITTWLNELAFVPVDYRAGAPADEWSGDVGCAVQYFCQQGVARLAAKAGIEYAKDMPFAERLVDVQRLMKAGDGRARRVYAGIGVCFGYAIARFADFYPLRNLLILGRVTSGPGGELILAEAARVLKAEFPDLAESVRLRTPDEKDKRHGQAIAAASLPSTAGSTKS
ncbi:MAG: ROK family protein [Lentisphaerae bacterium]|nr:ROK family protein [Lentisphaerota bacterium]